MKLKSKAVKKDVDKVVVLNSGGFDSVVLAHEVSFLNPDALIYDLFFNYGQLNYESEKRCSNKCASKLNHKWKEIILPPFSWSDSVLSGGSNESQYIPLRNLVFISYALSFAQSIGANKVYCAFIDPQGAYYDDTSPIFLEKINVLSDTFGIKVEAPFIQYTKDGLLKSLVRAYGITKDDVHSCNFGNEPCGECTDCKAINSIFADVDYHLADDILIDNRFNITESFVSTIKDSKVTSAKVYINNNCQFNCTHCFIGKSSLVSTPLTIEEWFRVFEEMKDAGITSVDFFGKEPLYDTTFYVLAKKCKELGMSVSLITNGFNVSSYIDMLSEIKPQVTMSVENFDKKPAHRTKGDFILKNFKLLISKGIPVSASIDLSKSNVVDIPNIIKKLHRIGVKTIYIKPIRPFGDSEEILTKELLPSASILNVVEEVSKLASKMDIDVNMSFAMMDLHRMYRDCPDKFNEILGYAIQNRLDVVDGVRFEFELFCHRFMSNISVTPDGYVLGCASEYCTDYSRCSSVRELTISECITIGKESLNEKSYHNLGCYFCRKYRKNNSKVFEVG